ncbi:MAG: hypothetical protein ABI835_05430 [Chloroflexota bacterium]
MAKRKGGLSIVRISIIAAVIGIALIAVAAISFYLDQRSHQAPFEIAPYPAAAYWGESNKRDTSRNIFYLTADLPEQVALYYQQKMADHYGNNDQSCVRLPATGIVQESETNPNIAPFIYRCMFDNSGFNSSQYTQVEIYPGRADDNPALNAEGMTIVKYEQQWQR